ncbi:PD-(D/E)XK nuclease family transposase [[Eubacterium] contortum]|uniref:PD-(D/E)XK nuclease family transposase n=2 Tax=Bacillota TaxID=1239 RepID=A0A174BMS4_9FIRM|nr:PD-(D/E)XK nuclease family transposase [[Eubacterium] contortum] [Faecalicatena contorta]
MNDIRINPVSAYQFDQWGEELQEEFLDFCTGARGVKMTYDSFFKEIMNPELHAERLEELLSLLLEQKVKIHQLLPNESARIADENTLLIMDIVVELEDGSLANIEIQKIGYAFPGQRGACYSADLLLRQYKRVRSQKKKKFTYQDIKTVYTIIFFEKSTSEFHEIKHTYIHRAKQVFNTGLKMNMLQEYVLIPLDIFKETKQNKAIETKLDAWLSFLSDDRPERIMEIIEKYPDFRELYGKIYEICRNVEGVMNMFSEELLELDRNTVQYMIEEQQEQLDTLNKENEVLAMELADLRKAYEEQRNAYEEQRNAYEEQRKVREEQQSAYEEQKKENETQRKQIEELKNMLETLMRNQK